MQSLSLQQRSELRAADEHFAAEAAKLHAAGIPYRDALGCFLAPGLTLREAYRRVDPDPEQIEIREQFAVAPPEIVRRLRAGELRAVGYPWRQYGAPRLVPRRAWRRGARLHRDISGHILLLARPIGSPPALWGAVRIVEAARHLRQAPADPATPEPEPDLLQAFVVSPARRPGAAPINRAEAREWFVASMRNDPLVTKAARIVEAKIRFGGLSGREAGRIWSELVKRTEFAKFAHQGRKPKKIKQGHD